MCTCAQIIVTYFLLLELATLHSLSLLILHFVHLFYLPEMLSLLCSYIYLSAPDPTTLKA